MNGRIGSVLHAFNDRGEQRRLVASASGFSVSKPALTAATRASWNRNRPPTCIRWVIASGRADSVSPARRAICEAASATQPHPLDVGIGEPVRSISRRFSSRSSRDVHGVKRMKEARSPARPDRPRFAATGQIAPRHEARPE